MEGRRARLKRPKISCKCIRMLIMNRVLYCRYMVYYADKISEYNQDCVVYKQIYLRHSHLAAFAHTIQRTQRTSFLFAGKKLRGNCRPASAIHYERRSHWRPPAATTPTDPQRQQWHDRHADVRRRRRRRPAKAQLGRHQHEQHQHGRGHRRRRRRRPVRSARTFEKGASNVERTTKPCASFLATHPLRVPTHKTTPFQP